MSLSMTPSDISGSVLYVDIQYSTVEKKGQRQMEEKERKKYSEHKNIDRIKIKVRENDKGEVIDFKHQSLIICEIPYWLLIYSIDKALSAWNLMICMVRWYMTLGPNGYSIQIHWEEMDFNLKNAIFIAIMSKHWIQINSFQD